MCVLGVRVLSPHCLQESLPLDEFAGQRLSRPRNRLTNTAPLLSSSFLLNLTNRSHFKTQRLHHLSRSKQNEPHPRDTRFGICSLPFFDGPGLSIATA